MRESFMKFTFDFDRVGFNKETGMLYINIETDIKTDEDWYRSIVEKLKNYKSKLPNFIHIEYNYDSKKAYIYLTISPEYAKEINQEMLDAQKDLLYSLSHEANIELEKRQEDDLKIKQAIEQSVVLRKSIIQKIQSLVP